jgi:phosphoglycolate phosphatase-like HAD superfamily hydrolase
MASPLAFLTDFDGVWTNPWRELQAVHTTVRDELARLAGMEPQELQGAYDSFRAAVLASPDEHGWKIEGRLISYVDEDYFAVPTSIGQYIDQAPCKTSGSLKEAVLRDFGSILEFLDYCYHDTCARFRAEIDHDLTEGAERVLQWLCSNDVHVVFATNAPAEKVVSWFSHHGFGVADAASTEPGEVPLRVYGRAGKQWLGDTHQVMDFAGREVHVDRPQYRAIIERENPDLLVGDVLSLDLAMPLAMRAAGEASAPRGIGIMHLPHTPDWVLESVGPRPQDIDFIVPHVTALPRLVNRLRESAP